MTSVNLIHFNTSNVTTMNYMFGYCKNLTNLDLSSFDTSNAANMSQMFYTCDNLTTIYVGPNWTTSSVTNSTSMFSSCTALVGGNGTAYNDSNPKDKTYARVDEGTSSPGYFTLKSN